MQPFTELLFRSVHNIRIERLWVDFTAGVGSKWKTFFEDLEGMGWLNADNPSHIWLIHFLFLDALNADIQLWADTWNNHKMSLSGERNKSPREMKMLSLAQQGPRGFEEHLSVEEIHEYGVDWESLDNQALRSHNSERSTSDIMPGNPFVSYEPEHHPHVEIDEVRNPLSPAQTEVFLARFTAIPYALRSSKDMNDRKHLFYQSLRIAIEVAQ